MSYSPFLFFLSFCLTCCIHLASEEVEVVNSPGELENAIKKANRGKTNIQLGQNITYSHAFQPLNADEVLAPTDQSFSIDGGGHTLTAEQGSNTPGFFIRGYRTEAQGKMIVIENLTIAGAVAKGGDGGKGFGDGRGGHGGGGLGAGGGIFLQRGSRVTLENVHFKSCQAIGGNGIPSTTPSGDDLGGGGGGGGGLRHDNKGGDAHQAENGAGGSGAGFDKPGVNADQAGGCGGSGFGGRGGTGYEGGGGGGGGGYDGGSVGADVSAPGAGGSGDGGPGFPPKDAAGGAGGKGSLSDTKGGDGGSDEGSGGSGAVKDRPGKSGIAGQGQVGAGRGPGGGGGGSRGDDGGRGGDGGDGFGGGGGGSSDVQNVDKKGGDGGDGGFGGGGGSGSIGYKTRGSGGRGGFGGGGGGAGGSTNGGKKPLGGFGGIGEFGGGGGGGSSGGTESMDVNGGGNAGGDGGFGGGGGGAGGNYDAGTVIPAKSTFGGGVGKAEDGKGGGSGSGAGLGGAIFLQEGSELTLKGKVTFDDNKVMRGKVDGVQAPNTQLGKELGDDIFMMSGSTLIINSDETMTLKGIKSNEKEGSTIGGGGLQKKGEGALTLEGANTYTGKTTLLKGKLLVSQNTTLGADEKAGENTNGLILEGGTLVVIDNGFTFGKLVELTNGTIEVTDGGDTATFDGTLTDKRAKGVLTKKGLGTLKLQGANPNDYTGGTIIERGTILLSGGQTHNLGYGPLTIRKEGKLVIENGAVVGNKEIHGLNGDGKIELNNVGQQLVVSGGGTFGGSISGLISLFVKDKGLTLSGNNTFTGNILIEGDGINLNFEKNENLGDLGVNRGIFLRNGGALRALASATLSDNKTIGIVGGPDGDGSIAVVDTADLTLEGKFGIDRRDTLTKKGGGNVVLAGNATGLHGTFAVESGMVTIGKGAIVGRAGQAGDGDMEIKRGGTVTGEGTCSKPVKISSGGTLMGRGTYQNVESEGTVKPGSSSGTLTLLGTYRQTANGILKIEVDDSGACNHLKVIGQSTLSDASQLVLDPQPGIYDAHTSYDFFTAAGGFTGGQGDDTFAKVTFGSHSLTSNTVKRQGKELTFILPLAQAVLPVNPYALKGNAKEITTYLFDDLDLFSTDLKLIIRKLLSKDQAQPFSERILQLGPQQFGALPLMTFQSGIRLGKEMSLTEAINRTPSSSQEGREEDPPSVRPIWMTPIGYYYKQAGDAERAPFNSRTYGLALGYRTPLADHLFLANGFGYTYSDFDWQKHQGSGSIQSVYLSPSLTCTRQHGHIGGVMAGGMSFYDVNRNIRFSDVKKVAHSHHHSFNLLIGVNGALKLETTTTALKRLFCIPMFRCDFLTVFENGYQESGAGALNLSVLSRFSAFLRPEIKLKLLQEVKLVRARLFPSVYVGWLKNMMLNHSEEQAKLSTGSFSKKRAMVVKSTYPLKHQCVVGAELTTHYEDGFSLTIGYEANVVGSVHVQEGKLNLIWKF